ncbi:O-antigen ligase family protein [bacterium]|nr:O-antigen ligase family protein [bacterium]
MKRVGWAGMGLFFGLVIYIVLLQTLPSSSTVDTILLGVVALVGAHHAFWKPRVGGALFLGGTLLLLGLPFVVLPYLNGVGALGTALIWWGGWGLRRSMGKVSSVRGWALFGGVASLVGVLLWRLQGSLPPFAFPLHWHNQSAALLLTTLPSLFVFGVSRKGVRSLLGWGGMGALLISIVLSGSRAVLALALLGLFFLPWVWVGDGGLRGFKKKGWVLGGLFLLFSFFLLSPRFQDLVGGFSSSSRMAYGKGAILLGASQPLSGVGWGEFTARYPAVQESVIYSASDPHSWVLRAWAEGGIWGLLFGGAILLSFARSAQKAGTGTKEERALLVGAGLLLLHAFVDFDATFLPLPFVFGALWGGSDPLPSATKGEKTKGKGAALVAVLVVALWGYRQIPPQDCSAGDQVGCAQSYLARGTSWLGSTEDLRNALEPRLIPVAEGVADHLLTVGGDSPLAQRTATLIARTDAEKARRLWERAIQWDPHNFPETYLALAQLEWSLFQDRERALSWVDRALSLEEWGKLRQPEEVFSFRLDARSRELDQVLGRLWLLKGVLTPEDNQEKDKALERSNQLLGED